MHCAIYRLCAQRDASQTKPSMADQPYKENYRHLPLSNFIFHTKFLQKVRLDQTWKLSKIVTYVVVSTMSDIFFVKLIGITAIWLKMWDFTRFFGGFWACKQTRQTQFSKWMQKASAEFEKDRPALSTLGCLESRLAGRYFWPISDKHYVG